MSRRLEELMSRARQIMQEAEEPIEIVPAVELHVFDFDKTLHNNYKALQCADIMKQLPHTETLNVFFAVTKRDHYAIERNTVCQQFLNLLCYRV